MKNKKEELSTNAIILIILGVVVLAILLVGFTLGWNTFLPRQEITIHKEVCEEEIDTQKLNEYIYGQYDYLFYELDKEWRNEECDKYAKYNIDEEPKICDELREEIKQTLNNIRKAEKDFAENPVYKTTCYEEEVGVLNLGNEAYTKDYLEKNPNILEEKCECVYKICSKGYNYGGECVNLNWMKCDIKLTEKEDKYFGCTGKRTYDKKCIKYKIGNYTITIK